MNVGGVKQELGRRFPGVVIKENANEKGEVTEIVGEIDKKLIGSERAVAVVVADSSPEHYHEHTVEEYQVLKGSLKVFCEGRPTLLREGETMVIKPWSAHRVEGDETWFYCFSVPEWTPEDFHLVDDNNR